MRTFKLYRKQDLTGTSGIGYVAEGVLFKCGRVALSWTVSAKLDNNETRIVPTVTVFDCIDDARALHSHQGSTILVYDDELSEVKAA